MDQYTTFIASISDPTNPIYLTLKDKDLFFSSKEIIAKISGLILLNHESGESGRCLSRTGQIDLVDTIIKYETKQSGEINKLKDLRIKLEDCPELSPYGFGTILYDVIKD
ncbi:MAG: hypothetical protein PHE43_01125 [Candidatus Nanoarchaeia archaeon]|nr:hypothetical protein [Candidatus Nanoarchaeia archaeon]